MKQYRFIDLFAGLGGFHLALEKLGCKCVFASELQQELQKLYFLNHGIIKFISVLTTKKEPVRCILYSSLKES